MYSWIFASGLLLSSLGAASPTPASKLWKRDPAYDVLRGTNFPDPSLINLDGTTYAFGTGNQGNLQGVQVGMTSNPEFSNAGGWSAVTDAFPAESVPAFANWAQEGTVWAPDVNHLTDFDGSYAMYYSPALRSNGGIHCIGVARSLNVEGPYNDSSTEPWVCPEEAGGAIDAAGFLDKDNSRYVMYKIDGQAVNGGGYCASTNNLVFNTSIMLQHVEADGYTKIGSPVSIWNNQGVEDQYNTEAPSLVLSGDGSTYFLFFSTGCYTEASYTTSYVTSTSGIFGPYGDKQVLLKEGDYGLHGPGSADVTPGDFQIAYHSLVNGDINQGRVMSTGSVTLEGQTARIN